MYLDLGLYFVCTLTGNSFYAPLVYSPRLDVRFMEAIGDDFIYVYIYNTSKHRSNVEHGFSYNCFKQCFNRCIFFLFHYAYNKLVMSTIYLRPEIASRCYGRQIWEMKYICSYCPRSEDLDTYIGSNIGCLGGSEFICDMI